MIRKFFSKETYLNRSVLTKLIKLEIVQNYEIFLNTYYIQQIFLWCYILTIYLTEYHLFNGENKNTVKKLLYNAKEKYYFKGPLQSSMHDSLSKSLVFFDKIFHQWYHGIYMNKNSGIKKVLYIYSLSTALFSTL